MSFQIKPNRKETENKTIRFPVTLIKQIEETIQQHDVTFSGFVIQACEICFRKYGHKLLSLCLAVCHRPISRLSDNACPVNIYCISAPCFRHRSHK